MNRNRPNRNRVPQTHWSLHLCWQSRRPLGHKLPSGQRGASYRTRSNVQNQQNKQAQKVKVTFVPWGFVPVLGAALSSTYLGGRRATESQEDWAAPHLGLTQTLLHHPRFHCSRYHRHWQGQGLSVHRSRLKYFKIIKSINSKTKLTEFKSSCCHMLAMDKLLNFSVQLICEMKTQQYLYCTGYWWLTHGSECKDGLVITLFIFCFI